MKAFLSKKREKAEKENEQQNEKEGEKQEIGQNLGKLEENRRTLKEIENITESDLMVQQWKEYIQEENLNTYDVQYVGMARVWIFDESVWKNMEIVGALCIVIDLNQDNQIPYIIVYDMNEFEIKFKLEIFIDFQKQVISLNDYFFYVRIPFLRENCQIGFSFSTENQCSNCKRVISKICPKSELNQEKNISGKQNCDHFSVNRYSNQQEQKENGAICEENENQDEYHEIAQEKERLNNLSNLTKEEKEIIRNAGITKKELKEDDQIKNIVKELFLKKKQDKQREQQSQLNFSISSNQKNNQQEGGLMSFLNNRISQINVNRTSMQSVQPNSQLKSQIQQVGTGQENTSQINNENIPINMPLKKINEPLNANNQPPPLSQILGSSKPPPLDSILKNNNQNWGKKLEISSMNKNQGSDNKKDSNKEQVSGTRNQLLDQIRNNQIKLRHVETNKVKKDQEKYTKEDKVDLAANLATEIKKRRQIIRKNYMDSDESEESDWDEDSDYDM